MPGLGGGHHQRALGRVALDLPVARLRLADERRVGGQHGGLEQPLQQPADGVDREPHRAENSPCGS